MSFVRLRACDRGRDRVAYPGGGTGKILYLKPSYLRRDFQPTFWLITADGQDLSP